jgi:hypothetical protein
MAALLRQPLEGGARVGLVAAIPGDRLHDGYGRHRYRFSTLLTSLKHSSSLRRLRWTNYVAPMIPVTSNLN